MNGRVDIVSAVNICSEIYCNRTAASAVCSRSQRFYHQHFSGWPCRVRPLPPVTRLTEAESIMAIIKIITPIEQLVGLRPSVHPHCVWRYPQWCMVRPGSLQPPDWAAAGLGQGLVTFSWQHSGPGAVTPHTRGHHMTAWHVITWRHDCMTWPIMSHHDEPCVTQTRGHFAQVETFLICDIFQSSVGF